MRCQRDPLYLPAFASEMKRPAPIGSCFLSIARTMVPMFVLMVALTPVAGTSVSVVVVLPATVVVVGLTATLFLSLRFEKKLMRRIAATKTATAIAALRIVRLRRFFLTSASRASRAARALSFLRWRLSALGTAAECTGRRFPSLVRGGRR